MANRAAALALSCFLAAPFLKAWPVNVTGNEREAIRQAFSAVHGRERKQPMRVGSWALFPAGFGFVVPEGMALEASRRGDAATLVSSAKKSAVRANILLTVAGEDKQLHRKTSKDVEGAARMMGFDRFVLLSFERDTFLDTECLRYTFLWGSAPRMFSQVCVFNRDGKCYIQTLSVAYDLSQMQTALCQFGAFRDSFFFLQ